MPRPTPLPSAVRAALALCAAAMPSVQLLAYESYHDPALNDQGYCSTCHPGFKGGRSDTLHALHTGGSDPVTSNCDLCHTGSGRDNPLTMWSAVDSGTGLGCAGCHGHDHGETIGANYGGYAITGKKKNSAYGLRKHHKNAGITVCADCHVDTVQPYPENVINPGLGNTTHYYFRTDVSLGGKPVDPSVNEDTANDADSIGSDNDGDLLYDSNDPDTVLVPDKITIERLPGGAIRLSWPTPSPGWLLQSNPALAGPWTTLPALDPTQRVNGFWFVTIQPPLPPALFYRLTSTP